MAKIVHGAMIGGTILPEQEFKEVLLQALQNEEYEKRIISLISLAVRRFNNKDYDGAYEAIEDIEVKLFQNPPTSLMVITNLSSPTGDYQWVWNKSEKRTLKDKGAIDFTKAMRGSIIQKKITKALSKHLQNMIKMVESQKMTNEDYDMLFNSGNYRFGGKSAKSDIGERAVKESQNGKTLAYIFYGDMDTPHRQGKIADAFLNHLGNMHHNLFSDFSFQPNFTFSKSVLEEEGSNFYQLLLDSRNNTGWWTGGDLILLSDNEIIANIQLKTIQQEQQTNVGEISSDKIFDLISDLKDFTEFKDGRYQIYNKEVFVEKFYNAFKTSGIIQKVEDKIMEIPIEYAKKNLKNIPDINISFS